MEHVSSNQVLQRPKGSWGCYSTDRQQEIPVFLLQSLADLARSLSSLQVGFPNTSRKKLSNQPRLITDPPLAKALKLEI